VDIVDVIQRMLQGGGNAIFGKGGIIDLSGLFPQAASAAMTKTAANTSDTAGRLPDTENYWSDLLAHAASLVSYNFAAGTTTAGHLSIIKQHTQRMAYPQPGHIWGTANTYIYLDRELLFTMAGVPITQGNSSLRPSST